MRADVVIYGAAPSRVAEVTEEAFRARSIAAKVERAPYEPTDGGSWVVLVEISLARLLDALGSTQAGRQGTGGEPAWPALRAFVEGLALGEAAIAGIVLLRDQETGIDVVLGPGLPDDAYRALVRVDLAAYSFGPVHYDAGSRRWRSLFDERQQPSGV